MCKMLAYCETLSVVCSVLNLTGLSVERWIFFTICNQMLPRLVVNWASRYYAVVHPLKAHYLCTISQVILISPCMFFFNHIYHSSLWQARKVTKGLWLLAAILSLPTAYARVNIKVVQDDGGGGNIIIAIKCHLFSSIWGSISIVFIILIIVIIGGWADRSLLVCSVRVGWEWAEMGSLDLEKSWALSPCHCSCPARVNLNHLQTT